MMMPHQCPLAGRQFARSILGLAACALVSGCAVGPDFHPPVAPAVDGYTRQPLTTTARAEIPGGEEQRFVNDQDISHEWWVLYQSPQLNALIERAIKANPTLAAAQAALRQAMELVYAQQGFFLPTIQTNFSPSRQRASSLQAVRGPPAPYRRR